jgi:hypothetical protein
MDMLTAFGLFAVTTMLVTCSAEVITRFLLYRPSANGATSDPRDY